MVYFWVVRDSSGFLVDMFDIGYKHNAEMLRHDYGKEYGDTFIVSLEMHRADGEV